MSTKQYHEFDTLQINIEFPTWSSTSSCDNLGYNENFNICNDSFQPFLRGRAYDIWGDMGIGIPHKVYLGSTIRG